MTGNKDETAKEQPSPKANEKTDANNDADYSDLYPGRRDSPTQNWFRKIVFAEQQEQLQKTRCEVNVVDCIQNSPLVKLMMAALKSSGCEVDIGRHISCEVCDKVVTGGYDPQLNQIIVCQNTARTKNRVQSTLSHEMIHMFDYCQNKLDLNNIDHLACTEIRAASLCHCSYFMALSRNVASPIRIARTHRDCVIDKAVRSIVAVKDVTKDEALTAVLRVFERCYNDLEPVGRRIRRNSHDMEKAYLEGPLYGYTE
ncbi:mitochondrial inner membrane protease ATP23 homolog [Ceratina calcarata]|uniref:Mitochondrial inner membrane protease ATP23 n=1 Tax=Ceratina calcarata TaxID=156304 RepID=A0AAJ7J3M5_9HYME|nr:mitochondrial inner membrane protease ATP23 homolog [Ceratina calcarata]